ncbi:GNAT family N-acetyltransferase [Candidatus Poribacteria bacterium]|nr:GNAT family N-acetyltransferase [Candidatus Poribacteria bacterium]MYB02510.1 GNAT family N-acetyltransferase [Candidatus Poribacteria bacterium]
MKFTEEMSQRIIELDAICFPPPEHSSISEFNETELYDNLKVFSLCDDKENLIGYAAWGCPWNNGVIYLARYGIAPKHRRLGFGFLLLTYFTSEIRKSYTGFVWADVRSENRTSRRLFQKAGWTEYVENDQEFDAEPGIRVVKEINGLQVGTRGY